MPGLHHYHAGHNRQPIHAGLHEEEPPGWVNDVNLMRVPGHAGTAGRTIECCVKDRMNRGHEWFSDGSRSCDEFLSRHGQVGNILFSQNRAFTAGSQRQTALVKLRA